MLKLINLFTIDDEKLEIYIINSKIYLSLPKNFTKLNFEIKNMNGCYVSYGWIDSHTHCDKSNKLYGVEIDKIGYKTGVTTVIDAGSVGVEGIVKMFEDSNEVITNLKLLVNISKKGIYEQSELKNFNDLKFEFDSRFDNFVVGYKARMSSSVTLTTGTKSLYFFNKFRKTKKLKKPLMIHIGNEPPNFKELVKLLHPKDIITHIFNYKNYSVFDENFKPTTATLEAIKKNIKFDVGHGNDSFSFQCAKNAFSNKFTADVISTDIYEKNITNHKVKSLANVMGKFRAVGYSWKEIIDAVTINPAKIFNLKNMGAIKNAALANLTFFLIKKENSVEVDSQENPILLKEIIIPVGCVVNGLFYEVKNERNI